MVPQSSNSFYCRSGSQPLSGFLLRRVPGLFRALSDNCVGGGCSLIQESSTHSRGGVDSAPRLELWNWKEK